MATLDKIQLIGYAAIIVIIVSLATIGVKFTGFATANSTAVVNVTIVSSAAINFTTNFMDFGGGSVTAGFANATVNTEGLTQGGNWSAPLNNLTLENIGSTNVSLALLSNKNASAFIGGTAPLFQFKLINDTKPLSCVGNNVSTTWTNLTTSQLNVCTVFPYDDSKDQLTIEIQLSIPYDSPTSSTAKTATITAMGTYT